VKVDRGGGRGRGRGTCGRSHIASSILRWRIALALTLRRKCISAPTTPTRMSQKSPTSVCIAPSIPSELRGTASPRNMAATRPTPLRLLCRRRPGLGPLAKSGFGASAATRCPTVKRWSVGTVRQLAGVSATIARRRACPQTVGAAAIAAAAELRSSASPKTRAATLDAPILPAANLRHGFPHPAPHPPLGMTRFRATVMLGNLLQWILRGVGAGRQAR